MKTYAIAEHQKKIGKEGRDKVFKFIAEHPLLNARECAEALGMKYSTVSRYIRDEKKKVS